jgi:NAD(P)-dependent dehydrogenase (short-subunit alcohol dehydrogenase family)
MKGTRWIWALAGRTAVTTGASQGIGLVIAHTASAAAVMTLS